MDNRRDKDKEFDRAQAMDRLTQDDKDKMSLIRMMMAKEKESMKEDDVVFDDRDGVPTMRDVDIEDMVVDRVKEIKPLFPGIDNDILVSFVKTHRQDIRGASDEDIKDEFEEFMSVNTEYVREENFISPNEEGDEAVGRESASGAFEESKNWRGETLKEQFKRLSK